MKIKPEHTTKQNEELFTLWAHFSSNNGMINANQLLYRYAQNLKLKTIINDFTTCLKDENEHLKKLLKEKGTSLTPSFGRPQLTVPTFNEHQTDIEISATLSMNIATSLVTTSQALGQAKKQYTLLMYGHFHMKKAVLGAKLLHLSKEKRWLLFS